MSVRSVNLFPDARFVVSGEVAVSEVETYLSRCLGTAFSAVRVWRREDVDRGDAMQSRRLLNVSWLKPGGQIRALAAGSVCIAVQILSRTNHQEAESVGV